MQKYEFELRICAQTQDLQILKKFYMSQINPKEFVRKTAYSVQLQSRSVPLSLYWNSLCFKFVMEFILFQGCNGIHCVSSL